MMWRWAQDEDENFIVCALVIIFESVPQAGVLLASPPTDLHKFRLFSKIPRKFLLIINWENGWVRINKQCHNVSNIKIISIIRHYNYVALVFESINWWVVRILMTPSKKIKKHFWFWTLRNQGRFNYLISSNRKICINLLSACELFFAYRTNYDTHFITFLCSIREANFIILKHYILIKENYWHLDNE